MSTKVKREGARADERRTGVEDSIDGVYNHKRDGEHGTSTQHKFRSHIGLLIMLLI